jgi:hypothetical protein
MWLTQLRLLAVALVVQPGIGAGGRFMCLVGGPALTAIPSIPVFGVGERLPTIHQECRGGVPSYFWSGEGKPSKLHLRTSEDYRNRAVCCFRSRRRNVQLLIPRMEHDHYASIWLRRNSSIATLYSSAIESDIRRISASGSGAKFQASAAFLSTYSRFCIPMTAALTGRDIE